MPLTYVSEKNALSVFTLAGVLCAGVASRRIARVVSYVPWFMLAALVFALEGGWTDLWLGQEGLVLMLVVTLAWLADRERHDLAAGWWTGLAVYAKPFLGGLLVYWVWRRQWRSLGFALATMAGLTLVGIAVAGSGSYVDWWRSLGNGPAPYSPLNASLLGLWSRLFFGSEFAPPLVRQPLPVLLVAWAASMSALLLAIWLRLRVDRRADTAWALILLVSMLASPLGWIYYLPLAAGPILACLGGTVSWICVWTSAYILLLFRSNVLATLSMSAGAAVSVGSIYAWALLVLFLAVWFGGRHRFMTLQRQENRL